MFKTPPFRGFFVESWILVKMDQFWNCNNGSPFPSNTQVSHHFGKPQGSPLRWSNQFLMVASILGAISPWMCGIGGPIPKKSVLIWIFSSGYLTWHLLRIPKWYVTPWNGHSKYLQIQKKQNLIQMTISKVTKMEPKTVFCEKSCLALHSTWVQLSKMVHHDRGCIRIWFGTYWLQYASAIDNTFQSFPKWLKFIDSSTFTI